MVSSSTHNRPYEKSTLLLWKLFNANHKWSMINTFWLFCLHGVSKLCVKMSRQLEGFLVKRFHAGMLVWKSTVEAVEEAVMFDR